MWQYLVFVLVLSGFSDSNRARRNSETSIACGEVIPEEDQLIWNFEGTQAKRGAYPWHVGIYWTSNNVYLCGGTIISKHVVLTTASGINNGYEGTMPASYLYIQAGKLFSEWNAPKDKFWVQKRSVSKIVPSNNYLGPRNNLNGDIALMIVDKPFRISRFVRPVCVDWNSEYVDEHLKSGVTGQMVGWGTPSINNYERSIFLKQHKFTFIERDQCARTVVPQDAVKFITPDKYCAGYIDGTSICIGGNGNGMIFSKEESGTTKYYIQGISSHCFYKYFPSGINQLSISTKISPHINWLKKTLEANNFTFTCKITFSEKAK